MATTKKPATTKAPASTKVTAAELQSTTKAVQDAISRALQAKQLQPKIKGPIFVGIIYDPIAKQFRVVNQFE